MKLLLLMSASGSLMVVFYFLFKVFVKGRVSAKWRYRMLKAALFFYLIGNCVIRRMRSQVRKANLQRMRSILFYTMGFGCQKEICQLELTCARGGE